MNISTQQGFWSKKVNSFFVRSWGGWEVGGPQGHLCTSRGLANALARYWRDRESALLHWVGKESLRAFRCCVIFRCSPWLSHSISLALTKHSESWTYNTTMLLSMFSLPMLFLLCYCNFIMGNNGFWCFSTDNEILFCFCCAVSFQPDFQDCFVRQWLTVQSSMSR